MTTLSGLPSALVFLLSVIVAGTVGYRVLENYSWLEALYMTAITLSTVGFHEIHPLSPTGQIFTMLLIAAGLGVVLYTMVAVVEKVVEGEFQQVFGRRRMQKQIEALTAHYIVCGFGRIGQVICRELISKPVSFVVIEQTEVDSRAAEAAKYLVLAGDAMDEQVLLRAGIRRARGLFATLATDADNVFLTLTAKELNPSLVVVARAESARSERTLLRAGANKVISPYAMGGHRMAQAALRPAVVDIIDLATHSQNLELQMEEISIPASSPWNGKTLHEAGFGQQGGIIIVAIKRAAGKLILNPTFQEVLQGGDSVIALAEASQLKAIEQQLQQGE